MHENLVLIFAVISCVIGIIGAVLGIATFVINRKDKAVKDTSDNAKEDARECADQAVITYRLGQVELKLDKVLDYLDGYPKEMEERIDKKMELHIKMYHSKER